MFEYDKLSSNVFVTPFWPDNCSGNYEEKDIRGREVDNLP